MRPFPLRYGRWMVRDLALSQGLSCWSWPC